MVGGSHYIEGSSSGTPEKKLQKDGNEKEKTRSDPRLERVRSKTEPFASSQPGSSSSHPVASSSNDLRKKERTLVLKTSINQLRHYYEELVNAKLNPVIYLKVVNNQTTIRCERESILLKNEDLESAVINGHGKSTNLQGDEEEYLFDPLLIVEKLNEFNLSVKDHIRLKPLINNLKLLKEKCEKQLLNLLNRQKSKKNSKLDDIPELKAKIAKYESALHSIMIVDRVNAQWGQLTEEEQSNVKKSESRDHAVKFKDGHDIQFIPKFSSILKTYFDQALSDVLEKQSHPDINVFRHLFYSAIEDFPETEGPIESERISELKQHFFDLVHVRQVLSTISPDELLDANTQWGKQFAKLVAKKVDEMEWKMPRDEEKINAFRNETLNNLLEGFQFPDEALKIAEIVFNSFIERIEKDYPL